MQTYTPSLIPRPRSRSTGILLSLLAFVALAATLNMATLEQSSAQEDHQLQAPSAVVKGMGVIAAAAAVASIPRIMKMRGKRLKGPKKRPTGPGSTSATTSKPQEGPTEAELNARIGHLATVRFPTTKDPILCRLLKVHKQPMGLFVTINIENGKVGTRVACQVIRDTAMKMAATEMLRMLQREKQKQGKDAGQLTMNELMLVRQQAFRSSMQAIGNGTAEGVADMVGVNASVVTVQAEILELGEEKVLKFFEASMNGNLPTVQQHLQSGMSADQVDGSGRTAIYFASREGNEEVVTQLLASGANPDTIANNGATPMFVATQSGHLGIMKALIQKGVNIQAERNVTYHFLAAQNGHLEALNLFLDAGVDPTKESMNGFTDLYIAAQNGHTDIVKRLVQEPAVKATVNEGMAARQLATPALIASQMGHLEVLKALVEAGASCTQAMSEGTTPLKAAAAHGDPETVQFILDHGGEANSPNKEGVTALMAAAAKGNVRVAELLLKNGADPKATTKTGQDALSLAKSSGKTEITMILEKALGK